MRVQTMLGGIISGTNEKLFGPALVLIRIAVGGILFVFGELLWVASHGGTLPANEPPELIIKLLATHGPISIVVAVSFMLVGGAYVFGLMTRPAGIALLVFLAIIDLALLPLATVKIISLNELFLIGMALLAISGGLGNAFGLNGLILRNLKNPGAIIKFLFS